jgi:uncharacterized protein
LIQKRLCIVEEWVVQYNFEWDPEKARQNLQKHKIAFEKAAEVFLDPMAISVFDEGHSSDEERWATMGRDKRGMILIVVHTFIIQGRDERKIRIITARKATRNETKQYEGETS